MNAAAATLRFRHLWIAAAVGWAAPLLHAQAAPRNWSIAGSLGFVHNALIGRRDPFASCGITARTAGEAAVVVGYGSPRFRVELSTHGWGRIETSEAICEDPPAPPENGSQFGVTGTRDNAGYPSWFTATRARVGLNPGGRIEPWLHFGVGRLWDKHKFAGVAGGSLRTALGRARILLEAEAVTYRIRFNRTEYVYRNGALAEQIDRPEAAGTMTGVVRMGVEVPIR
jgi:hypothetical protein